MKHKHNGGPAFPRAMSVSHGGVHEHQYVDPPEEGMSLRDYFAAKALQGYFAAPYTPHRVDADDVARYCYYMADAMLKARETRP